jgi:hypothetical protein
LCGHQEIHIKGPIDLEINAVPRADIFRISKTNFIVVSSTFVENLEKFESKKKNWRIKSFPIDN